MSKRWNKGDKVYFVHWVAGSDTFFVYGEATVLESKVNPRVAYNDFQYKPGGKWIFSSPVDAEIAGRMELIASLDTEALLKRTKLEFYEYKVEQLSKEVSAIEERAAKLRKSIYEEEGDKNKEETKNE